MTRNDFAVSVAAEMPALGEASRGLRITSENWNARHDSLELQVSGIAGAEYDVAVWNPGQIASVDGAELRRRESALHVKFPATSTDSYVASKITVHFSEPRGGE
jgi:hypothetical protein